ncbi:MAG TPA: hypothetical protein VEO00_00865 [Actinomycetota bacterium]|nr:hypothetical protein [Actinomycetota bacterium]
MDRPVRALIVSRSLAVRGAWARWLRTAGIDPALCHGPAPGRPCPRANGDTCPLREWADVAIVDPDGTAAAFGLHSLADLGEICTRVPDDGTTLVLP